MADVGFEVESLATLAQMTEQMRHVAGQVFQLSAYVGDQVANKEGFTGLLEPFQETMDVIDQAAADLAVRLSNMYYEVIHAVETAGLQLDMADGESQGLFASQVPEVTRPGMGGI